jgi:hypothetical protein
MRFCLQLTSLLDPTAIILTERRWIRMLCICSLSLALRVAVRPHKCSDSQSRLTTPLIRRFVDRVAEGNCVIYSESWRNFSNFNRQVAVQQLQLQPQPVGYTTSTVKHAAALSKVWSLHSRASSYRTLSYFRRCMKFDVRSTSEPLFSPSTRAKRLQLGSRSSDACRVSTRDFFPLET